MVKKMTTIPALWLLMAVAAAGISFAVADESAPHQLTVDDTLDQLLENPDARAVLEQELPILLKNPQIEQARSLSLRSLKMFAPTLITDEKLAAVDESLAGVGAMSDPTRTAVPAALAVDPRAALSLKTFPLWENGAPGARGDGPMDTPTLTVVATDGATAFGTAVIVAPGGGYQGLATGHEGRQVADWFAAHGVTAFVLTYRLCSAGYHHPAQLQDAQRAIRWVRAHAQEYGIDPGRIGMIGFSAGGHLTAMAETLFDDGNPIADDPVERASSRPDFAVRGYPAIDWPANCIAGERPDKRIKREVAPMKNVTAQTPPTFIFHTSTDEVIPPSNATRFYDALRAEGVPAELHIFAEGRHGLGLAMTDPALAVWPSLLADWLRGRKLIGDGVR